MSIIFKICDKKSNGIVNTQLVLIETVHKTTNQSICGNYSHLFISGWRPMILNNSDSVEPILMDQQLLR